MKKFTQNEEGYEQSLGYIAFKTFLDTYLVERNYEKTISFVDDDYYCLGTGRDEVITNKSALRHLLQSKIKMINEPISYEVNLISGKEVAENVWNILAVVELLLPNRGGRGGRYTVGFSGCFIIKADGFVVTEVHLSAREDVHTGAQNGTGDDEQMEDWFERDIVPWL